MLDFKRTFCEFRAGFMIIFYRIFYRALYVALPQFFHRFILVPLIFFLSDNFLLRENCLNYSLNYYSKELFASIKSFYENVLIILFNSSEYNRNLIPDTCYLSPFISCGRTSLGKFDLSIILPITLRSFTAFKGHYIAIRGENPAQCRVMRENSLENGASVLSR